MKLTEIEAAIEAALFAAGEAVSAERLGQAVGADVRTLKALVARMQAAMEADNRGIEIIELDGAYQLRTRPAFYGYIKTLFQNPARKPLTQALLETLAIIAYRQPVTKAQIEDVRRVDAGHAVNRLVELGLVAEQGRAELPGRPILFGTTEDFLRVYGFTNVAQLPRLPDGVIEAIEAIEAEEELQLPG